MGSDLLHMGWLNEHDTCLTKPASFHAGWG